MNYEEYVDIILEQAKKEAEKKGVSLVKMLEAYQLLYNIAMMRLEEQIMKEYKKN